MIYGVYWVCSVCCCVLGVCYGRTVVLSIAAADAVVGLPGEIERWADAERGMLLLGHSTQFDGEAGASLSGVQSPGLQGAIPNLLSLIPQL